MMTPRGVASVTLRSWGYATVDFLIAAVGLFVVVFPALSVVVTLATGDPLGAGSAGFVAFVVAFTDRFRLDRNPTTVPEE